MPEYANAFPRKRFFLEMFTRDISVEDCILDLIDNSIDALIRTRNIRLSSLLLKKRPMPVRGGLPKVELSYSPTGVELSDGCGGIPRKLLVDDLFSFGHTPDYELAALGAYGVGLKRALFKLGRHFEIESRAVGGGFLVRLDLDKWAKKDDTQNDWKIAASLRPGVGSLKDAGTTIRVTRLREDVQRRLSDPATVSRLDASVRQTYALFLERHVQLAVQGRRIKPDPLFLARSDRITPGSEKYTDPESHVNVTLMVGLAPPDSDGQWPVERAGWYVFCNGRLVVPADKTDLTGWGTLPTGLPAWHPKYRSFRGIAFFESENPLALPWTTTKRGLNRESSVYQDAKRRIVRLARPAVKFLNELYPADPSELTDERDIARDARPVSVAGVVARQPSAFTAQRRAARGSRSTISVQYQAEADEIDRARKRLGKPHWGAGRIGKYALEYYLKRECPQ